MTKEEYASWLVQFYYLATMLKFAGSVGLINPDIYIGIVKVSSKDGDDTVLKNLYENGLENPFNLRMKAEKNVPNHLIIREINVDNPMPSTIKMTEIEF